eukprot:g4148.t1
MTPAAVDVDAEQQEPAELSEAYVHSLASLGLERLQNEPGRLHAEAKAVDEALHALSLDHYRVFIQNQECVRHVRVQGKEMERHLESLLGEARGLGAEFSVFQREAAELVGGHKRNRQTLKHHMQLVELLEVPQLMDACVRSDLMEEALSIATFASTLERRHRSRRPVPVPPPSGDSGDVGASSAARDEAAWGHVPGVIKMIVDEVRESARSLHERLVAKLRGPIQLTNCLQVVSCLRRLELLALEEKNEEKLQQQRQRALRRAAEAEAEVVAGSKTSPRQNGGGGSHDASKYLAGLRVKDGEAAAEKLKAKALGGGRGGSGVSQRQLALVEMKLQVDFLEARDAWLADAANRAGHGTAGGGDLQLGAASVTATASPYQVLMDLIESSRSQWFEVATQFRAIFLSVDASVGGPGGSAAAARTSPLSSPRGPQGAMVAGSGRDSGDVLSLWLLRRVSAFVEQLKSLLPLVEDGGLLRSLLEECMFFGASMGRLGTDFRGLLVPVFEERVTGAASGQWATASADFVVTLRDIAAIEAAGGNGASLLHVPEKTSAAVEASSSSSSLGLRSDSAVEAEKAAALALLGDGGGLPPPPRSLMAFPPVARLLNVVLTSFNQLRECLPSSVEDRLADTLVACFTDAFRGLADLKKTTLRTNAAAAAAAAGDPGSTPSSRNGGPPSWRGDHVLNTTSRAVELACAALAERAVPHLALCFAALFGESPTPGFATTAGGVSGVSGGGNKGPGRAEKLRGRLLGALETFGIYEPPPPPAPAPAPATPAEAVASSSGLAPPAAAAPAAPAASPPPAEASATATAVPSVEPEGTSGEGGVKNAGDGAGGGEGLLSPGKKQAVSLSAGGQGEEEGGAAAASLTAAVDVRQRGIDV